MEQNQQPQEHQAEEKNMKMIEIMTEETTSTKQKVMPLKRKVTVLSKMMILKLVKRIRVLMIEMLVSQRSFIKCGVIFLHPLMRVKLWESDLQGYVYETKRSKRGEY